MSDHQKAYESLLARVEKPGRYLGNERGMVRKNPLHVSLRFALAFPDVYEIAQSHPGLQILYDLLNRRPDIYAERAYAPWFDMEAELRRAQLPLVSLETFTPLSQFHIVGFTLQYELTYTNLLAMLELGGIPLRAADRGPHHPLIIAGGPCAFNPEPLADFLDAVLLGDGENAVHEICDTYLAWDRRERSELLAALSGLRGIYVPAFFEPRYTAQGGVSEVHPLRAGYERVEKHILTDLNSAPIQETYVVPTLQVVHDRPSLEVMRGCVKGCRFCQAGYIYRPLRERDPRRVLEQAERAIEQTGHDEISLLSLSTGDYSCVNPLLTELMNRLAVKKVAVSLPSTRVDALAPSLLEQIKRVRKTGFTLAPEAGSQRLRDIIQKEYQEGELINAARQIFALGWRTLKLYFMLGLPSETEEDLMGIVELSSKVASAAKQRVEVIASVSNFVPKPHTPFQWASQISISEIERRQAFLRRELGKRRIKFRYHDGRLSYLEGIFSRGDRRSGALLLRAYELGCRFDGWNDNCRFELWEQALADTGLSGDFYLRRRMLDEPLPWGHLSSGVSKAFLQRELALAFERTLTPDCSVERCTYCGACDFRSIRNVDYHVTGAKAAEHRGAAVDHWASDIVSESESSKPGAWEPRGWHKIQAKKTQAANGGAIAGDRPQPELDSLPRKQPGAAEVAPPVTPSGKGLGNAEEWLAAGGEALAPELDKRAAVARVRLTYGKRGRSRFIGNLELTLLFYRAVRRAGLPIAFTQGHHPLPRFGFGPALPLGTESDCEMLDVDLTEPRPAEVVAAALGEQLPEGMDICAAECVPLRSASVAALIAGFQYRVDVSPGLNGDDGAYIRERITAFNEASEFPLRKHSKGKKRIVDARPFVARLAFVSPAAIETTLRFGAAGMLKPADLIGAVLDVGPSSLRVHKVATHLLKDPVATEAPAAPPV